MFISKKMHNKIVRAKEDEIVTLEDKVENRDILISDLQAENLAVHDERFENEKLSYFKRKVVDIINEKETIVNKYDKIKELVDNLDTEN